MSGPEHYREAERLLGEVHAKVSTRTAAEITAPGVQQVYANIVARAQVHATLALAAATANERIRIPQGDGTEYDVAVDGPAPTWADVIA